MINCLHGCDSDSKMGLNPFYTYTYIYIYIYTLYDKHVGSLTSPADHKTLKMQETGPTIYRPYPRRLEHLTICTYHCKYSIIVLLSYFKTLSVGPVWDLNPRPPAQQSGALPTELLVGGQYKHHVTVLQDSFLRNKCHTYFFSVALN